MKKEGLNLDFMDIDRSLCERSDRILLVKNLNHRVKEKDLRELFEFYGMISKILLAPNKSIAIVEFLNPDYCKNAFEKLQYHKFRNNFLYLEYAPVGMMTEEDVEKKVEDIKEEIQNEDEICKVVYVKNLNFETEDASLYELFEKIGPIKYARIVKSKEGKSMGYGFVEF
jgi:multiple RNA-binding domain-containing protein 1